jgi:rSAM/selenodomain-associated transferase 1
MDQTIDECEMPIESAHHTVGQVGLGIFAKTAALSSVKTRLAASIGKAEAETFYHLSVLAIEQLALALPDAIRPYWAVAEANGLDQPQWRKLPHFWTGDGDLGTRLHQVYSKLRKNHDAAILIGTDSPQLTPSLLEDTQKYLTRAPKSVVLGPCSDGGFYLFAGGVDIPQSCWTNVPYSESSTLQQLSDQLHQLNIKIHYLREQQDVDVVEDLRRLQVALAAEETLLSAQKQLLDWLSRTSSAT